MFVLFFLNQQNDIVILSDSKSKLLNILLLYVRPTKKENDMLNMT